MNSFLSKLVLSFIILSSSAHALVFVEPMIGYATGSSEFKYTDSADPTANAKDEPDIKGLNYGIKGGVDLGGLQLGAEYMQNNLKKSGANKDFWAGKYEDSFRATEMSALLGYRFWFARIYGGYIFSSKLNKKDSAGIDFKTGNGHKFGFTFYALSHLALSLEYRNVKFDDHSYPPSGKQSLNYNTTALIVSFPFGI